MTGSTDAGRRNGWGHCGTSRGWQDEEILYRQAEKFIKERFNFYTSNYPNQNTEMYLVMTILDIAVQLKRMEMANDFSPALEHLKPMLAELEKTLANK